MAVTIKAYGKLGLALFNKEIDWLDDTIKCALLDSGYTPDQDAHDYFDDVVAEEVTGTGYTAGGATLAGKTIAYTGGTNVLTLDCDNVTWPTSTITARYGVVYDATPGSDATRPLICYIDFGADESSAGSTFEIQIHANGLLTATFA